MTGPEECVAESGFPLTRPQQRMLALHRKSPQADMLARAFLLRGPLDVPTLARAVAWSARKGPVLSSVIREGDAAATRRQGESIRLQVEEPARRACMDSAMVALQHAIARPFDLARGPLLRVIVIPVTEEEHLFLFHAHHIVVDGYSIALGLQGVIEGYAALRQGGVLEAQEPEDGLARIAHADAGYHASESGLRDAAYWSKKLESAACVPERRADEAAPSIASAVCASELDGEAFSLVANAAKKVGTTRPGLYAAAFQQVLETAQPGSSLSTTFTLRRTASLLRVLGPLMTYGLLTTPRTRETFQARALRLGEEIRLGQVHARGADTIGPHGTHPDALPLHRTALISFHVQKRFTQLSLGYGGGASDILAGLTMENVALQTRFVPYGLFLSVGELQGKSAMLLVYNRTLYRKDQARAILDEVRQVLLESAAALVD